jgi:hypothetical protein
VAWKGGEITPSAMPRTEEFSILMNCFIAGDHKGAILNDGSVIDLFTNKGV